MSLNFGDSRDDFEVIGKELVNNLEINEMNGSMEKITVSNDALNKYGNFHDSDEEEMDEQQITEFVEKLKLHPRYSFSFVLKTKETDFYCKKN